MHYEGIGPAGADQIEGASLLHRTEVIKTTAVVAKDKVRSQTKTPTTRTTHGKVVAVMAKAEKGGDATIITPTDAVVATETTTIIIEVDAAAIAKNATTLRMFRKNCSSAALAKSKS